MKKFSLKKSLAFLTSSLLVFSSAMPSMVLAAEEQGRASNSVVYTRYKETSSDKGSGTKADPYNSFEDAVTNVSEGGTIIIAQDGLKGGFLNTQDEEGTKPYVINKNVTIKSETDTPASLTVRCGGIVLGADVTMENVELDFANKYHNAIFVNGNTFNAYNVTVGSGSRNVNLMGGTIADYKDTPALPASGNDAQIIISGNSKFENIYGGSLNGAYDGSTKILIDDERNKIKLGEIYASGADETQLTPGSWFDVNNEPAPPKANALHTVSGKVSVELNHVPVSSINGAGAAGGTELDISTEYPVDFLSLENISKLSVKKGTITPAKLTYGAKGIDVSVAKDAKLDLSATAEKAHTIKDFVGGGTLAVNKDGKITITGSVSGTTAFETGGGFNGNSGVAEYDHEYINAANAARDSFTFAPLYGQSSMTLTRNDSGAWTTSAAPQSAEYLIDFQFDTTSVTYSEGKAPEFVLQWTGVTASSDIVIIPFEYTVEFGGNTYTSTLMKDETDGDFSYYAKVEGDTVGMRFDAGGYVDDDGYVIDDKAVISIEPLKPLAAGTYRITVAAPTASGEKISREILLVVKGENQQETTTTVTANASASFGDTLTINAAVANAANAVNEGSVEFFVNDVSLGKMTVSSGTGAVPVDVITDKGFKVGENEIKAVFSGTDTLAGSLEIQKITVSKAENVTVETSASAKTEVYNGKAHTYDNVTATVKKGDKVLAENVSTQISYEKNGKAVNPILPGEYTVKIAVDAGETYTAANTSVALTITAAKPAITVSAKDNGNGNITLTAYAEGVSLNDMPAGNIAFIWDGVKQNEVALNNGSASMAVADAATGAHTYSANYVPKYAETAHYTEAASAQSTINIDRSKQPTSLAISPSNETVTGGGEVAFTVRKTNIPENGVVTVVCDDTKYNPKEESGVWKVVLPNETKTYKFTASYAGDEQYNASSAACSVNVTKSTAAPSKKKTATTVETDAASYTMGGKITITANVSAETAVSNEAVKITVNGKEISGTHTLVNGKASVTADVSEVNGFKTGSNVISAAFEGTMEFEASTGSKAVTVSVPSTTPSGGGGGGGGGAASGSSYSVSTGDIKNGSVSLSATKAAKGNTVTLTVSPDKGYSLEKLTVTDKEGKEIALTDKGSNKYTFVMPDGEVKINAEFAKAGETAAENAEKNFADVLTASYFYNAVKWAIENGITSGTDETHFSPNAACTRAQVITFIWRAAGAPMPTGGAVDFTDIDENAYYANAVQWAVENGIAAGISETEFAPQSTITRAQAVSFMYRAASSPTSDGKTVFSDVAENAYYADAVQWAVENNITSGTGNNIFSPKDVCTRAQIVTFLYRLAK